MLPLLESLDARVVAIPVRRSPAISERSAPRAHAIFPRAAQEIALAELARSRSSDARISLPGGLVAIVDGRRTPHDEKKAKDAAHNETKARAKATRG